MSKFKVGDEVIIRYNAIRNIGEFGWNPQMGNYVGKRAKILVIREYNGKSDKVRLDIDNLDFIWNLDCLELYIPKSRRIKVGSIITIKDNAKHFNKTFGWNTYMDKYLGKTTRVTSILPHGFITKVILKIDEGRYSWAINALEVQEPILDIEKIYDEGN